MIFKKWYTGMEMMDGFLPPWYLGRTGYSGNVDAQLYILIPFNYLFRACQWFYFWAQRP